MRRGCLESTLAVNTDFATSGNDCTLAVQSVPDHHDQISNQTMAQMIATVSTRPERHNTSDDSLIWDN